MNIVGIIVRLTLSFLLIAMVFAESEPAEDKL